MTVPLPTVAPVTFITATRLGSDDFFTKSPLYRSTSTLIYNDIGMITAFDNRCGLPNVYNRMVDQINAPDDTVLVFCHDDIHLLDYFWPLRIFDGLERFDIVGLAGNRRRAPGQISWNYINESFHWDDLKNLSGSVGHGESFPCPVAQYGPVLQPCATLDGMFLAMRAKTLRTHDLRFDERFDFHFYDMDFCRHAEGRGLSMGTIPISVIHESEGGFGSDAWRAGYRLYLDKWGD